NNFEELVRAGIERGMESAVELAHDWQNPQATAQAAAREREPAGPGGKTATPGPVDIGNLPPAEQRNALRGIVDRVKATFGRSPRGPGGSDQNF
ncbi:MAG TPA: hypothetical protein VNA25_25745, partial [Phycisphaerae bacterium]|nr:hypothetical protein [Phycisphaerae bacterium]